MKFAYLLGVLTLALVACGGGSENIVTFEDSATSIEGDLAAADVSVQADANISGTSVEYVVKGDVTVSLDLVDGVLVLSDDCDGEDCSVDYAVLVEAAETDVLVTVGTGSITVATVTGLIDADTGDGSVTLTETSGDIDVVIGDGSVLGTRLEAPGATFDVGTGDIDVTFDNEVASLIAATGEGDVTVQLPEGSYAFDLSAPDGSIDNLIDTTEGSANEVSVSTDSGDITVYRR